MWQQHMISFHLVLRAMTGAIHAGADKLCGKTIPLDGAMFGYTLREPIGVVAAVIPWNFPIAMAALKAAYVPPPPPPPALVETTCAKREVVSAVQGTGLSDTRPVRWTNSAFKVSTYQTCLQLACAINADLCSTRGTSCGLFQQSQSA